jgi:methionyl aminopeptidase
MIIIKTEQELQKIREAGRRLAPIVENVKQILAPGISTLDIDAWIERELEKVDLVSQSKGYRGYQHASCISLNTEIVHGVPSAKKKLHEGDLVTIDVCAAWQGYCADMARTFVVGNTEKNSVQQAYKLIEVATHALDRGIEKALVGGRLTDISSAIQREVEKAGFSVIRDFCGHGIGKKMHEEPEILNYGAPGRGPVLQAGMVFAIEPMIAAGDYAVKLLMDGWTAVTADGSLAAHVEDTVIITMQGPEIVTRLK